MITYSKRRKCKNNNGFSLIELVIAIAVLIILIALIAPQFMRYLDRARRARDLSDADTVMKTVQVVSMEELIDNKTHDQNNKELPSIHYEAVTNYIPTVAAHSSSSAKDRIQAIYNAMSGSDPSYKYAFICLIDNNNIVKARYKNLDTKKFYCWEEGSDWREYTASDFENEKKSNRKITNWGTALAAGVPNLNSLDIWWNGLNPKDYSSEMEFINQAPIK